MNSSADCIVLSIACVIRTYQSNLQKIAQFSTVEDFWRYACPSTLLPMNTITVVLLTVCMRM